MPLTDGKAVVNENNSTCRINSTTAHLYLVPATEEGEAPPYQVIFTFSSVSVSKRDCLLTVISSGQCV